MTKLIQMRLPDSARSYFESLLGSVPGLYAKMMVEVRARGELFAIVPTGTSASRAEQYNAGGFALATDTEGFLVERLEERARGQASGVLILQDFWFKPEDYTRRPPQSELWICEGEAYLWTEIVAERSDELQRCLRSVKSFNFAGFLVTDPLAVQKLQDGSASLKTLAANVAEIYVPAYDLESFLVWTRE